jgi:7-cyano-7-deazaguanine tRNA-ribosyltransferase
MSFEIKEKDLLARVGKLTTKTCSIETPALLPVINPARRLILPKDIKRRFGFEALITNAYIIKKHFQNKPAADGLHRFLDFDGALMTDSGAYQILVYGDIEISPSEIVDYQERIDTDIATILDIPTGWDVTEEQANRTVDMTLKRAIQLFNQRTRDDILWVGPVQGGKYLNLVAQSARKMARLPFDIYALGSPTEVMERYRFDVLVDMIMAAKADLPIQKPLHLFGAGHPLMFSLAVALGCDIFDSAAYALYAKEGRYMTENGTQKISELEYFPCSCPRCSASNPKHMRDLSQEETTVFLAEHNLHVCAAEMRRIKQSIREGRLWEHMETRGHSHPALLQAMKKLRKYAGFIERNSPATKKRGVFYFDSVGLSRPEILRYQNKLSKDYSKPEKTPILALFPQMKTKPFHKSHEYKFMEHLIRKKLKKQEFQMHVCIYSAPFGVVPIELDEIYPLSQHETAMPFDAETKETALHELLDYIRRSKYKRVLLVNKADDWGDDACVACRKICREKGIRLQIINLKKNGKAMVGKEN